MSGPEDRQAWAEFWGGGATHPATCLPKALGRIDASQTATWLGFALALPKRAQVLDLGTGDGVVLKTLQQARGDLRLTGVDSAPLLPTAPRGLSLRPGVDMAALPFGPARFDAVSSQFGYEYSDTSVSAGQVARVLRPGGRLLFVVHHRDGPIVAHNLPRRDALRWALSESGYLAKANALVGARRLAPLPTPPIFRAAPGEAARLFPGQSAAGEFLEAIFQTLELSRGAPAADTLADLAELANRARNEVSRIGALDRAACDSERLDRMIGELRSAGLAMEPPRILTDQSGRPFAWVLAGARLSDPETSR